LAGLVKDALAWMKEHNCASCHHASLVVWATREAKLRGHAVDEPVMAELTKWVAESGDGKFGLARPASAPKAASPPPTRPTASPAAGTPPWPRRRAAGGRLPPVVQVGQPAGVVRDGRPGLPARPSGGYRSWGPAADRGHRR
jgi:hypothetical protein